MERIIEELLRRRNFNYIAFVNNADMIRNKADDRKVVRDKEVCCSSFLLELFQKVEHLCTDGNVKRGDRFVRNDKFRLHDHRSRETDSLSLPARKLMRVSCQMFGEKSDLVYHVFNLAYSVSLVFKEVEVVKSF